MTIQLKNKMTILFQGDSITDCDRNWYSDDGMGYGYANMVAQKLNQKYPGLSLYFLNRGISGDRVENLCIRWERDCLQLKPDVVSILVGVNNTFPQYFSDDFPEKDVFYHKYYSLLQKTREVLNPQLILCEPFLIPVSPDFEIWHQALDPKIAAVRKLAEEFAATLVPFNRLFAEAVKEKPPTFWAEDGVHPTQSGHAIMAQEWLKQTVGLVS